MARLKVLEGSRPGYTQSTDALALERLIAENSELRHTAVDLVLQTAILRKRLSDLTPRKPVRRNH